MSISDEQDKKPIIGSSSHITLKVVAQDESQVVFRVKRDTPLRKLMEAYCVRQNVNLSYFRFVFDGDRIRGEQTPEQAGLHDGDEIDVFTTQIGGKNYA